MDLSGRAKNPRFLPCLCCPPGGEPSAFDFPLDQPLVPGWIRYGPLPVPIIVVLHGTDLQNLETEFALRECVASFVIGDSGRIGFHQFPNWRGTGGADTSGKG